jgi:hypothetical protein
MISNSFMDRISIQRIDRASQKLHAKIALFQEP